ncbi:hypothetical protein MKW98_007255, partial [Papaver atlanticum]
MPISRLMIKVHGQTQYAMVTYSISLSWTPLMFRERSHPSRTDTDCNIFGVQGAFLTWRKHFLDDGKIAKDSKETVQECVAEFNCSITS